MAQITIKASVDIDATVTRVQNAISVAKPRILQRLATLVDPWTPYRTGKLSSSAKVVGDSLVYDVDYANDKYYGTVYTKTVHPLATDHWVDVAMQTHRAEFNAICQEEVLKAYHELYG